MELPAQFDLDSGLLIGIVGTNYLGDGPLIAIVRTIRFGSCPLIGIVRIIGYGDCLYQHHYTRVRAIGTRCICLLYTSDAADE